VHIGSAFDFDTNVPSGIRGQVVRGAFVTGIAQAVRLVLQTGSTVVLGRLLTPVDYGLVGMIAIITSFLLIFRDVGLGAATIQEPTLQLADVSTLFWINTGIGFALALLTVASAPAMARFYGDQRLVGITVALSIPFIFAGAAVQHQAVLRRQMRFGALAAADIISLVTGTAVGVAMAAAGAGYWALVSLQVVTAATASMGAWFFGGWWPGRPRWNSTVRRMTGFGGHLTTFTFLNYFSRNADNLLIGKFWGAEPLGLYSRAYQLVLVPMGQVMGPLGTVAVPALSRLRSNPLGFVSTYLSFTRVIAYATMPLVCLSAAIAPDLIVTTLGAKWSGTVPIYRWLTIPAMVQPVLASTGWLFIARGRAREMAKWGVGSSIVIVAFFLMGIPYGALGISAAYAFVHLLLFYPCLAYAIAGLPLRVRDIGHVLFRASALGASMAAPALFVAFLLPSIVSWERLLASSAAGILAGCCFGQFIRPIRKDVLHVFSQLKSLRTPKLVQAENG
jgi:O-antigen/teichoic acid export membrane protein